MEGWIAAFSAALGLGLEPKELTVVHIALRGAIVLVATMFIMRVGNKRSLARKTALDAVLLVILASVLSRAINGTASFVPTLLGSLAVVLFHRGIGFLTYRSHWLGRLFKGVPEILVLEGELQRDAMRRNHISDHDLEEDLRLGAKSEKVSEIKIARIERSGDISFIKKEEA